MKAVVTPLFGLWILVVVVLSLPVGMMIACDTREDWMLGYLQFGLVAFGAVVQAASAFWFKSLKAKQRRYWWTATVLYGTWLMTVLMANLWLR
jgi:hypothetical protein